MNKSTGSLADQLQSLGLVKQKIPRQPNKKKGKQPASDFRSKEARNPGVADLEAEMKQKLANSDSQNKDAKKANVREIKPAKRHAAPVIVETRRSPPSRVADPGGKPSKPVHPVKQPNGRLTGPAIERLHEEPKPSMTEAPRAPAKAAPVPTREPAPPPKTAQSEIPGVTRPFKAAEAFEHIIRVVGASRPAIEKRSSEIRSSEAHRLDEMVRNGAKWLRDNPNPDLDNGFVVGFDFGTSSMKIVVRDPYVAGNPVAALPAPLELRSQGHPFLWQTVVWLDPADDTFRLYPTPGAITLEGFKTGIIAGKGAEPICDEPRISRSEGASAFVALHLCHLLGWYAKEKPLARSRASNFLAINIGVPVATSDNPAALQPFKEVVRAAAELACSCEPLTIERVRAALDMVKAEDLPNGFDLVPELSANLVGYASDPTSPWGAHVLVDVGASTLDIVAFNLVENEDEPQIKAFSASVELFGAAALDIARSEGIADADFAAACNHQFGDTYLYACREDVARACFSPTLRSDDVELVITGGGCATPLHSRFVTDLRGSKRVLGEGKIVRPEPPREIAPIDCDRSRLLLAFGLAHDKPDIPPPTLPSRIPKIAPKPDNHPGFVGPEQV